jgi:predicted dehydrogenase
MAIFSVHLIDRLQWLAHGEPLTVNAVTRRNEASGLPGEQFTTLIVEFDDGAVAHMTSSWMSQGLPVHDMRVDTTTGSVAVRRTQPMSGDAEATAAFGSADPERVSFPESALKPHGTRTYGLSMKAFVDAIQSGTEATHSGRNNLRTMGIMEAAYLSAGRGGETVEIAEALSAPVSGQR